MAPNPGPRAPQPSPHGQTDIVCLQHGHTSATCPRQRARVGAGRRQTAGMGMEGCWGSTPQPSHTTVSPPRGLDQAGKTLPCSCSPWPVASGSIMGMGMGCLPPGRSFGVGLYQYLDQLLRPHLPVHLQAPDFGDAGAQPPVLPCQQDEPLGTCFGVGEAEPPGSPKPCCPASLARAGDARPLLSPAGMQVPAHLLQMTTQRLMEAQSGLGEPQSAQKRLDSTTQILSATSELERASAMDCCMASTHSSFSWSESAEKLPAGTGMRDGMAAGRGSTAGTPLPSLISPEDPVRRCEIEAPAVHLLDIPHVHLDVGDADPQPIVLVGEGGAGGLTEGSGGGLRMMHCLQELVLALTPAHRTGAGGCGSPCPLPAQLPAPGVHGEPQALEQLQWVRWSWGSPRLGAGGEGDCSLGVTSLQGLSSPRLGVAAPGCPSSLPLCSGCGCEGKGSPSKWHRGPPWCHSPPPPPATHLRVLVEENFVPGHRHEQLVLKPSQLQEAALVGRVGGTAGGRGHQCPLQSFALPLLRDLLQGPYPLVTVRCGAGGETGQDQPGARSLRGSSLGSGEGEGEQLGPPRSRDPPPALVAHRHSRPETRSCGCW